MQKLRIPVNFITHCGNAGNLSTLWLCSLRLPSRLCRRQYRTAVTRSPQELLLIMRDDIRSQLEQLCGCSLPSAWQLLIRHYPPELLNAGRGSDDDQDEGTVSQVELLSCDSAILQINLEVRAGTYLDPAGSEFRWPAHYLVIGETGDGDYYCLDALNQSTPVLQYRCQLVCFETAAESLDEFVELLYIAFTEDDSEDPENPLDDEATAPDERTY